jgi:hypothetical protein
MLRLCCQIVEQSVMIERKEKKRKRKRKRRQEKRKRADLIRRREKWAIT